MGSDNARRGRRYEALPADNADQDERTVNHQEGEHDDHQGDDRQPLTRGRSSSSDHASEAENESDAEQQQQVQAAEATTNGKGETPELPTVESAQANNAADSQGKIALSDP